MSRHILERYAGSGFVPWAVRSAVVAGALLVVGATAAQLQVPPTGKTFYACYVPSTGTMYRIREPGLPTECNSSRDGTSRHVMFSWRDASGAAGSQALTGAPGRSGTGSPVVRTASGAATTEITIQCAAGQYALGGGGTISNHTRDVGMSGSFPVDSRGAPARDGQSATGWRVTASGTATLQVYAICGS
jgi:hypothetical protein